MTQAMGWPARLLRMSARLLLLALSVGAFGPMLHDLHADDCEPSFIAHDETAHHFQSATPDPAPYPGDEHCVACHFARSSRGPVAWESTGFTPFSNGYRLSDTDAALVATLTIAQLPARAPPRA